MRKVLVFGATGQAGYYLCKLLTDKGYEVIGTWRDPYCAGAADKRFVYCDFRQPRTIDQVINAVVPDEVYNMSSMMFAPASWDKAYEYIQVNLMGTVTILDTLFKINPEARYFQAGSAEVFGQARPPQYEKTPLKPRNPYGVAKASAQELTRVYRQEKGRFACTGIFFNMESERRADTFFARKVTLAAAKIAEQIDLGLEPTPLELGDLSAERDWGLVEEYVEAAYLMLQASKPKDYVIGSGESHTCLEFAHSAFDYAGVPYKYLFHKTTNKKAQDIMWSDPGEIRRDLGWSAKTKFASLIQYLVSAAFMEKVS